MCAWLCVTLCATSKVNGGPHSLVSLFWGSQAEKFGNHWYSVQERLHQYGLEVPKYEWATPAKVVENDLAEIPWHFQIQNDKLVVANQPDIMLIDNRRGQWC